MHCRHKSTCTLHITEHDNRIGKWAKKHLFWFRWWSSNACGVTLFLTSVHRYLPMKRDMDEGMKTLS